MGGGLGICTGDGGIAGGGGGWGLEKPDFAATPPGGGYLGSLSGGAAPERIRFSACCDEDPRAPRRGCFHFGAWRLLVGHLAAVHGPSRPVRPGLRRHARPSPRVPL